MQCCRCREEMLIIEYAQIEIDYCPDCGIWLDSGEIELMLEEAGGNEDSKSGEEPEAAGTSRTEDKPIKCPVCRSRMEKGLYSKIADAVVDRCPKNHGIWLDRGELREIIDIHMGRDDGQRTAVTSFLANLFGEE